MNLLILYSYCTVIANKVSITGAHHVKVPKPPCEVLSSASIRRRMYFFVRKLSEGRSTVAGFIQSFISVISFVKYGRIYASNFLGPRLQYVCHLLVLLQAQLSLSLYMLTPGNLLEGEDC